MKKLLLFLFPLLALGFSSCVDDGVTGDCPVTIVYKDPSSGVLKSVSVKIEAGTYVDEDYLRAAGLIPEIDGYTYDSFSGAVKVEGKRVEFTLYYKEIPPATYNLIVNYRDVAAPTVPLADQKIISGLLAQTVIDEQYLKDNGLLLAFTGLVISAIDPETQEIDGDKTVTIFYDKRKLDVTVQYREYGKPDSSIADDKVLSALVYGTVVNKAYLDAADAIKTVDNYLYHSIEPTELTITEEGGKVTVWYTRSEHLITIRYRDKDLNTPIPDRDNPGVSIPALNLNLPHGITIDEAYLRSKGYVKNIVGYQFVSINPDPFVVGEGGSIVDICYRHIPGQLTIEYWKGLPTASPQMVASENAVIFTGTIIPDYDWLLDNGHIEPANIPAHHHFHSMVPEPVEVMEAGSVVKIYYEPDLINVTFNYYKGKRNEGGTTHEAVVVKAIPYGTLVDSYQKLIDLGCIAANKIPADHIFDEMNPASFTVTATPGEIDIYYKSDQIPVTIVYHDGARGPGSVVHYTDATRTIKYGTEVTYQYLVDNGYIDNTKIPADKEFSSIYPDPVTVLTEGQEIKLYYYLPTYTVTVQYRGIVDGTEEPDGDIYPDKTFDAIKGTTIDAVWLESKIAGYTTPPDIPWTGFGKVDGLSAAGITGNVTVTIWYTRVTF